MSRRERQRRRRRSKGGPARPLFLALGVLTASPLSASSAPSAGSSRVANSAPVAGHDQADQDQGAASVVYAADGKRLGFISADILRTPVTGGQIPQVVRDATVAIEDRRFYEHKGVDFEGVVRAAIKNLESKDDVQGGSTLTMQLVRNLYTKDTARAGIEGYKRKIREAKLAEELENRHPGERGKRWILDQYLNNVPYGTVGGQTAVGIQAAARIFFDKPADELTLPEAALLAGLPQAPSHYNPFLNPARPPRRAATTCCGGWPTRATSPRPGRPRRCGEPLGVKRQRLLHQASARATSSTTSSSSSSTSTAPTRVPRAAACRSTRRSNLKMQSAARKALDDNLGGTDRSRRDRHRSTRPTATSTRWPRRRTTASSKFNLAAQGHSPAGLDVQGDGADGRAAQGRRPQQHDLHVDAAEVQRPHVGADRRPHLLRQLHRPR